MSQDLLLEAAMSRRLPVCARYASLHVSVVHALVCEAHGDRDQGLSWALGVTDDGYLEILGVWETTVPADGLGDAITCELRARGLESVRVIVQGALSSDAGDTALTFPGAATVSSLERLCFLAASQVPGLDRDAFRRGIEAVRAAQTEAEARAMLKIAERGEWGCSEAVRLCRAELGAIHSLSRRQRASRRRAEESVHRLQTGLLAALRRAGRFSTSGAALSFAASWLVKQERRMASAGAPGRSQPRIARRGREVSAASAY